MPQQVPPPHLRPTARPVSHVPLPRYAQPATPAPSGTPVPSGTPALSGTLAPLQGSGTSSPRPIVKLLGTPGYYTRKSRPPAPSPVPSELRLRSQVKLEPAETLVPAQAPAQAQAKAQPAAPVQAPAEAQPEAPAHSPTKPGIVVKLMSLNSTIMAAQREWEQGNRNGTPSSGSSSDSGASTASDIPNIRPARALPLISSTAEPVAGQKRSLDSSMLPTSSRPRKRTFSKSFVAPPRSMPPSLPSSRSMTPSHTQVATQNAPNAPKRGQWLKFDALDSIATRADGTPYEYYTDSRGLRATMPGALLPTNYRLDNAVPRPFVCPDKDCGSAFDNPRSLVGHFSAGHKGCAYNDNCDGTLSKVGYYPRVSGETWRAIVVSQVSVNESSSEEDNLQTEEPLATFTEEHVALTSPDPFTYLSRFLPPYFQRAPYLSSPHIQEICQLPKRRDLPRSWIDLHRNTPVSDRMFAIAAAYITGHEVFSSDACQESLRNPKARLSRECIAVPFGLSDACRSLYFRGKSCVSCRYFAELEGVDCPCAWSSSNCGFLRRYRKRVDGLGVGYEHDDGHGAKPGTEKEVAEHRRRARAVEAVIQAGKAPRWEISSPESEPPAPRVSRAEHDSTESSSADDNILGDKSELGQRWRKVGAPGPPRRTSTSMAASVLSLEPPTKPLQPVQALPPQLEMESWEVAPGRMIDPAHGENIGYSSAYLNGREPVAVSEDVSFNILTIKPGDTARWKAHESQLRTCSVASGKVEVRIGTKKFGTGPNSIFIIRPSETCVATNKLYIDAIIHCTTVTNYSLLS